MKDMDFVSCFNSSPHLLMEGAIGERLKREYRIRFDPNIAMGGLVMNPIARHALTEIWTEYAETAEKYGFPFMATTPTRRVNRERIEKSPFSGEIMKHNVSFLKNIKNNFNGVMFSGALIGCYGDAYTGEGCLDSDVSRAFHSWEIELFARENVDFFMAGLIPSAEEALGIAQAMSGINIPYIISFTLRQDGYLPDGTRLCDAIEIIDRNTDFKPICYMTNCIHPVHVEMALTQDFNKNETVRNRFLGIQANGSKMTFDQLDNSVELFSSAPSELAEDMMHLNHIQPIKIIGGCCGTNAAHIEEIARAFSIDN